MTSFPPDELYYITHIETLPSILEHGILSFEKCGQRGIKRARIHDRIHNQGAVHRRDTKPMQAGRSLLDYANLYFQPRNPMMYSVVGAKKKKKPVVVSISKNVLYEEGVFVADGSSTDEQTKIKLVSEGLKILERQWKIVQNDWWNKDDGSKRKIMAECLVPDSVKPEFISSIFVADDKALDHVKPIVGKRPIPVDSKPDIFFQPKSRTPIRKQKHITLVDGGDIFFSSMQTLTVTVNLQKIMGKGLALRAKRQFPDVYIKYEEACRSKRINTGRPYLYKRETSFNHELADSSFSPSTPQAVKWFLLFPTKRHWRDDSRIEDIEDALKWVKNNYKEKEIKSLALPALGCGLGKLCLNDVIPLMCEHLHEIGIEVEIYLPRDIKINPKDLDTLHSLVDQAIGKHLPLFKRNLK